MPQDKHCKWMFGLELYAANSTKLVLVKSLQLPLLSHHLYQRTAH